ncbi:hypothetical protein BDV19DRAFT_386606 [Aspergillus venezuelensis]
MSFWDVEPGIYLLDRLDPTFQWSSASTQAATEHFLEKEDSHLDDKRIIGLTIPGLRTRSVERDYGVIRKLVEIDEWRLKAHDLVEEMGPLNEEEADDEPISVGPICIAAPYPS